MMQRFGNNDLIAPPYQLRGQKLPPDLRPKVNKPEPRGRIMPTATIPKMSPQINEGLAVGKRLKRPSEWSSQTGKERKRSLNCGACAKKLWINCTQTPGAPGEVRYAL